ncbi:hypothetical protein CLCR_11416 [Cladophialophora carrionii]|uniref:Uncharacterized protein n=1 Tax=Cladophialophora carrionii TaxID=86049 RepID=A0A1C1CWU6_9EURO|nr:hypothetical protein CLCR_11416 [Cladophialophora carrionii]
MSHEPNTELPEMPTHPPSPSWGGPPEKSSRMHKQSDLTVLILVFSSLSGYYRPKCTTYSISKAAVNMLTVHQSEQLKDRGIKVICMDPGWVKTRMGGDGALLEPEESIGGMLKVVHNLKDEDTGKFYTYTGGEVPW